MSDGCTDAMRDGRLSKDDDGFKDICRKTWSKQAGNGDKCTKALLLTELYNHMLQAEKDVRELKAMLADITQKEAAT